MSKTEELKNKVLKAQQDGDIASLYVLEQQAHELFDEETLHGYYANILDLALEKLTETLAAALFEVIGGLSNDQKFSDAMKFHRIAAQENLSLDDFIERVADIEATQQRGTFYISEFQKEAQKLLIQMHDDQRRSDRFLQKQSRGSGRYHPYGR